MQSIIKYQYDDREDMERKWGVGPWLTEPDIVVWEDPETGLRCLVIRNPHGGNLCGYVGVPEGHPAYGADYDQPIVEVHKGLTFANTMHPEGQWKDAQCWEPDGPVWELLKGLWFLGFDCAHMDTDYIPAFANTGEGSMWAALGDTKAGDLITEMQEDTVYWPIEGVMIECALLAKQLADDLELGEANPMLAKVDELMEQTSGEAKKLIAGLQEFVHRRGTPNVGEGEES